MDQTVRVRSKSRTSVLNTASVCIHTENYAKKCSVLFTHWKRSENVPPQRNAILLRHLHGIL